MATKVTVVMGGASHLRGTSRLKVELLSPEALEKRGCEVPLDADAHLVDALRAEA